MEAAITYDKIQIECKVKILTLYSLSINIEPNEHAICSISGTIDERYNEEIIKECIQGERLKILCNNCENDKKAVSTLFQGEIISAKINMENQYAVIDIQAASNTFELDVVKKRRSFQNISMTYQEVVRKILKEYDSDYLYWRVKDKYLEYPLIQYDETDWEFIKRICSHMNVKIMPIHTVSKPGIHVGLIEGNDRGAIAGKNYLLGFNKASFFDDPESNDKSKRKYTYCIVEDIIDYRLGDRLTFQGNNLSVCAKHIKSVKGVLIFKYWLSYPEYFWTAKYYNTAIKGIELHGIVTAVTEEKIKLRLAIDRYEKDQELYFFNWKPITGNLFYCMPEIGQEAALYIPCCDEKCALAVNAIRSNGESCEELSNPDNRYFTTLHKKRMYFFPEKTGMELFDECGKHNELKLNDNSQVLIKSDKRISIMSEKQVLLKGKKIHLTTPKEATLVRKDILSPTVINLCNAFDAIGKTGGFKSNPEAVAVDKKLKPMTIQAESYNLGKINAHLLANIPEESYGDEIVDAAIGSMPAIIGK